MFWLGLAIGVVVGIVLTLGLCALAFAGRNWS